MLQRHTVWFCVTIVVAVLSWAPSATAQDIRITGVNLREVDPRVTGPLRFPMQTAVATPLAVTEPGMEIIPQFPPHTEFRTAALSPLQLTLPVEQTPDVSGQDEQLTQPLLEQHPEKGYFDPQPLPEELVERAIEAINVEAEAPLRRYPNIGTDRVPFALFEIDSVRPQNVLRLRFDAGFDVNRPDRAEYFWAAVGKKGPEAFGSVDYQEYSFYNETVIGNSSAFLEVPMRVVDLDPDVTGSFVGGFSDLEMGTKSLLIAGDDLFGIPTTNPYDRFKVASVFRTYFSPSNSLAKRGLSTGHVSLEPGLLAAYEISPFSMLHGEVKYWIPIAGDSKHAGDVVQYGLGFAHVHGATPLGSNSTPLAVIPTIELNAWEFLDGLQTVGNDDTDPANGTTVINVQAGVRCAIGEKVELGSSVSFPLTDSRLYASRFRFEIRWLR